MEATAYPDWSGLPQDLMATVMRALDIPDLFSAGAVCGPWRAAYSAVRGVRVPITDASPCLLYSCAADDAGTATMYSPSSGASFKVPLPAPAFRARYVVGSGHGWVVAADEASNLQLLNPLTGAQVDLPPVTGLHHIESSLDDHGRLVAYNVYGEYPHPETPHPYDTKKLRLILYCRAYLSCSPSAGAAAACITLLLHRGDGDLSFARVGDGRWTHVAESGSVPLRQSSGYRSAAYNSSDSLFYLLSYDCSIYTLDLNGASPALSKILQGDARRDDPTRSIVFAPWGDILQACRWIETRDNPGQVPAELAHEVVNPNAETYTDEIELYRVDAGVQKWVKMSSTELRGYAMFLGFNSTLMLSTEDFPMLKPNCAYVTDDSWENICINMYGCREVGIWNFEKQALEILGDVQSVHSWLNWPPPVWITPSLSCKRDW
ncbi:hypothetical protein ACP70R_004085 [Stipagrostis hirtigluma subsp. patula]